ncbi:MAG: hypothetical protein ACREE1_15735 [Stellaceae bacterium]
MRGDPFALGELFERGAVGGRTLRRLAIKLVVKDRAHLSISEVVFSSSSYFSMPSLTDRRSGIQKIAAADGVFTRRAVQWQADFTRTPFSNRRGANM